MKRKFLVILAALVCLSAGVVRAEFKRVAVHGTFTAVSGQTQAALIVTGLVNDLDLTGGGTATGDMPEDISLMLYVKAKNIASYRLFFAAPPGYSIVIDEVQRSSVMKNAGAGDHTHGYSVTLVRAARRGEGDDLPLGEASAISWRAPATYDVHERWPYVTFNLGNATSGEPLPQLRIPVQARKLNPNDNNKPPDEIIPPDHPDIDYTPEGLGFTLTAPEVKVTLTAEASGEFYVKFFAPGETTEWEVDHFLSYHFQYPDEGWPLPGSGVAVTPKKVKITKSLIGAQYDYETTIKGDILRVYFTDLQIEDWHVAGTTPTRVLQVTRTQTPGPGAGLDQFGLQRTHTDVILTKESNGAVVARKAYVYELWGMYSGSEYEDYEGVMLPATVTEGGAGSDPAYVTTAKEVAGDPVVVGWEAPGGRTRLVETTPAFGATSNSVSQQIYETWRDKSPEYTGNYPDRITEHGCAVTEITYESDSRWFDFQLPKTIERRVGDQLIAKVEVAYSDITITGDPNTSADDLPGIEAVRSDYESSAAGSTPLQTTTKFYRPDVDDIALRSRPYSIELPDRSKQSFAYERGTYTGSGGFTPDASGLDLRITILSGGTTGGNAVTGLSANLAVDEIHLHAKRSTKTVEFLQRGRLVRREMWVYTGGNGASPAFSTTPVTYESYAYTADGRLRTRTSSNGTSHTATWAGSRKTRVVDETELTINYDYDELDRISATTREQVGGLPALRTTIEYDAAHRVTFRRMGPVGGEQLVTQTDYESSGRLKRRVVPGGPVVGDNTAPAAGVTTDYEYPNGGRDLIETYFRGTSEEATRITTRYPDGRVQSITGSAVGTEKHYTHDIDPDSGLRYSRVNLGSATGRSHTVTYDLLGRSIEGRSNGFKPDIGSAKPIVTTRGYNSLGQLATLHTIEEEGIGALSADQAYEYDELGRLSASGLELNGDAGLQDDSNDRYTTTDASFLLDDNNVWWSRSVSTIYPEDGSSASFSTTTTARLTRTGSDPIAQSDHYDVYGNRTSVYTHPGSKSRITTTLAADGTRRASTMVGGLVVREDVYDDTESLVPDATTTYGYDALGRLTSITDPRNVVSRREYVKGSTQVWKTFEGRDEENQEIRTATYDYDAAVRVASITDANSKVVRYDYSSRGQLIKQWGTGAHPTAYAYNAYGERIAMRTFRNPTQDFTGATWPLSDDGIDPRNPNPDSWETGDVTRWVYDENTGWMKSKTDAASRTVRYDYSYAPNYKIVTRTSPRPGLTTTYKYRLTTGELALVDYSDNTPDIGYTYTRTGQLESVTEGTVTNGTSWPATFAAGARMRDFFYDHEQISSEALDDTWYGGLMLTTLYDNTSVQNPGGNLVPGRYAGFALGVAGSTAELEREMKVSLRHDNLGRIDQLTAGYAAQVINGQTRPAFSTSLSYDYDGNTGFWETLTRGSFTLNRELEAGRNVLKSVTAKWGATSIAQHVYTTTHAGDRESAVQKGTAFADYGDDEGSTFFKYGYNAVGELETADGYLGGAINDPSKPLPGRAYGYSYDRAGNRTGANLDTDSVTYAPNNLNQIGQRGTLKTRASGTAAPATTGTAVTAGGVTASRQGRYWDAKLELLEQYSQIAVTATRPGQTAQSFDFWMLFRPSQETLTYDEEGNLKQDSAWMYTYDAENRLVRMVSRTDLIIGAPTLELGFDYDYLGRRVRKTVTQNGTQTYERRFVYDGWNLIAEFELVGGAARIHRSYVWGLDLHSSLAATGGVGALVLETEHTDSALTAYTVASDGRGNVTALVTGTGATVAVYEYDPFGQLLRCEGEQAKLNPFRYSSKYQDNETGLFYYGYRYYDANLGRFINRDPIGEAGGANLYAFVGNSPASRWDYLGLSDHEHPVDDFIDVGVSDDPPEEHDFGDDTIPGTQSHTNSKSIEDYRAPLAVQVNQRIDPAPNSITVATIDRLLADAQAASDAWVAPRPRYTLGGFHDSATDNPYRSKIRALRAARDDVITAILLYNLFAGKNEQIDRNTWDFNDPQTANLLRLQNRTLDILTVLATAGLNEVKGLRAIFSGETNVALIGRSMNSVRDVAGALRARGVKVEIFDGPRISDAALRQWQQLTAGGRRLTDAEVRGTLLFKENQAWAEGLKAKGIDVLDLGNPSGLRASPFYDMEQAIIHR